MIVANQISLLMLDAHNANVIWPFHSSNACCWSSACQSNFGGWKMKLSACHDPGNRLIWGSWNDLNFAFWEGLIPVMIWLRVQWSWKEISVDLGNGLERKFHMYMTNVIFCKIWWSWKELVQGSWKELKLNLFGDNFWTAWGRGLKFCRIVHM